jgi:ribosomal protein L35
MPKMKTKRTLLKRIKITKKGKLMKKQTRIGHLKEKLDASTRSRKKQMLPQLNIGHIRKLKALLGKYGRGVNR